MQAEVLGAAEDDVLPSLLRLTPRHRVPSGSFREMLTAPTVLFLLLGAAWLCFHLVRASGWEHTAEEKGRKVRPCLLVTAGTSVWLQELKQHPRGAWAWS